MGAPAQTLTSLQNMTQGTTTTLNAAQLTFNPNLTTGGLASKAKDDQRDGESNRPIDTQKTDNRGVVVNHNP